MSAVEARRTQEERVAESAGRLLRAAIELIAEKGYRSTTAAEISERAGYSRPMVRERYGSKDRLLESILRSEYDARLFAPVEVEADATGLEVLMAQVDRLGELGGESPELMRSFLVLSFETAGAAAELQPWMRSLLARYRKGIAGAIRRGRRDGSIDAGVDPAAEAEEVVAGGIGRAFLALVGAGRGDFTAEMRVWRDGVEQRLRSGGPA